MSIPRYRAIFRFPPVLRAHAPVPVLILQGFLRLVNRENGGNEKICKKINSGGFLPGAACFSFVESVY
jgi:hypothetical protein